MVGGSAVRHASSKRGHEPTWKLCVIELGRGDGSVTSPRNKEVFSRLIHAMWLVREVTGEAGHNETDEPLGAADLHPQLARRPWRGLYLWLREGSHLGR